MAVDLIIKLIDPRETHILLSTMIEETSPESKLISGSAQIKIEKETREEALIGSKSQNVSPANAVEFSEPGQSQKAATSSKKASNESGQSQSISGFKTQSANTLARNANSRRMH